VRYLVGPTVYRPRTGSAAAFLAQLKMEPGQPVEGSAFPRVDEFA
jgi:hypothetical protein